MSNQSTPRKHICHICGRLRSVNALGRIAPHDTPKRRGHRCPGGGFKVAGQTAASHTKRYQPLN